MKSNKVWKEIFKPSCLGDGSKLLSECYETKFCKENEPECPFLDECLEKAIEKELEDFKERQKRSKEWEVIKVNPFLKQFIIGYSESK